MFMFYKELVYNAEHYFIFMKIFRYFLNQKWNKYFFYKLKIGEEADC